MKHEFIILNYYTNEETKTTGRKSQQNQRHYKNQTYKDCGYQK
jgi:hypothetical protein